MPLLPSSVVLLLKTPQGWHPALYVQKTGTTFRVDMNAKTAIGDRDEALDEARQLAFERLGGATVLDQDLEWAGVGQPPYFCYKF